jgi:hypothetical protein
LAGEFGQQDARDRRIAIVANVEVRTKLARLAADSLSDHAAADARSLGKGGAHVGKFAVIVTDRAAGTRGAEME